MSSAKLASSTLDLINWLNEQTLFPKIYWKSREEKSYAAAGALETYSEIPKFSSPFAQYFGGFSFFEKRKSDPIWANFPKCRFLLPKYTLTQENPNETQREKKNHLKLQDRMDFPPFTDWKSRVLRYLEKIQKGELQKIVLARRTTLVFDQKIDPLEVLSLLPRSSNSTLFCFQISDDEAFIGASPEKLYQRDKGLIMSEALAGTRARGKSPEEEERQKNELLASDKDRREFLFVKDFLNSTLSPLCKEFSFDEEVKILTTPSVHHLYQRAKGMLKETINDKTLLLALHPTPALGGTPRKGSLQSLFEEEPFDRGWYGAPIGWVSKDKADFSVGIRSALIQNNRIHLFAAVGIVEGSEPLKEWEELEHKIEPMKRALV